MNVAEDEDRGGPSAGGGDNLFGTETMAELCARQGRIPDAIAIYRQLLASSASDERRTRWEHRLEALGQQPRSGLHQRGTVGGFGESGHHRRGALATPPRPPTDDEGDLPAAGVASSAGAGAVHKLPLVIRDPVRSGQIVYAERNDLIVLGPVNPGAQLIADGNIHVYSRLRGRAVAGAHGAVDARIYCQKLDAELIGIDSAYLSAEDIPAERRGLPAQIFLLKGSCVVAPL